MSANSKLFTQYIAGMNDPISSVRHECADAMGDVVEAVGTDWFKERVVPLLESHMGVKKINLQPPRRQNDGSAGKYMRPVIGEDGDSENVVAVQWTEMPKGTFFCGLVVIGCVCVWLLCLVVLLVVLLLPACPWNGCPGLSVCIFTNFFFLFHSFPHSFPYTGGYLRRQAVMRAMASVGKFTELEPVVVRFLERGLKDKVFNVQIVALRSVMKLLPAIGASDSLK